MYEAGSGSRSRGQGHAALALAVLCGAVLGCAPPTPATAVPAASAPPEIREDAGPRYFTKDEVDLPAWPLAPIEPVYPPELRALGREGEVEARVVVLADGSVGGAVLESSSDDAFTAAAQEALREARFQPAERAGRPVASWITLELRFRLE